jgi:DNA excision repair protein ERCC-3
VTPGEHGADGLDMEAIHDALQELGRPVATADQLARILEENQAKVSERLDSLSEETKLQRLDVQHDPVVFYPTDWGELASTERVVPFPSRREIVVDQPTQYTRARLSQFARLVEVDSERYLYELRPEDIWAAPYDTLDALLETVRSVLPERAPGLESWIGDQYDRAGKFRLYTHEEGYVVLEAENESLMGNVAEQHLDDGQLRARMNETDAWVASEEIAAVKRILYEAGYPVRDERDLETGDPLDVSLELTLRNYQQDWVRRFADAGSGVLVGPPGSGKTVAAMGVMESIGGETLVLVPTRELATQWREELTDKTTLDAEQIGEYHGGTKQIRPVTISTYQTAGMDRHRQLFDSREWGLIVYDECQHIPSPISRRSATLQSKARLGLTATPVREDDKESEIYTLIGPPIGTDWEALFDAGFVAEPVVEIRHVPWSDDDHRHEYASAQNHERRQLAAMNPAKIDEVDRLLAEHATAKALIFVDYIDQGDAIADALGLPFLSGETPHARRERLLSSFRSGNQDALVISRVGDEGLDLPDAEIAIVASGLGGSRRQGAQRAGRTMRPTGEARVYVLATQGTEEEEFARRQTHHLAGKGVRVRETQIGSSPESETDGAGSDSHAVDET